MFSPHLFFRSISHALRGIADVARTEQSFRVQLGLGVLVALFATVLPLLMWERILLGLLIASVLVLEIVNSIFERFADAVHPRLHPMVREVKDMMAGAVFLASLTAALVGATIFLPHILQRMGAW